MVKRDSSLSRLLFFSAVVFTRANFDDQSPEWHPWQYINRSLFVRRPISISVTNILSRAHEYIKGRLARYSWYDDNHSRPTEGQIRRMVSLFRGDFEYPVSPRFDLEQIEQTIQRFTEEQFDGLDLLQENHRVLFKGPAGTGKTFIALEAVGRAVTDGMRVLFLCYNSLLGDWLKTQTAGISEDPKVLICRTFHGLLLEIAQERAVAGDGEEYWEIELPTKASDKLLSDERSWAPFDMIVVDEAQDLLREEYLDVMDLLLKGGLAGGKWAFFGDFERQAIYVSKGEKSTRQGLNNLSGRAPKHVNCSLRINCRNAEPIAQTLAITSGLAPGYKKILHDLEGSEVDPLFYSSSTDQIRLLNEAINNLIGVYKPGELIILSMRNDEGSCAGTASRDSFSVPVAPIRKVQNGRTIAFSSIHAFKGLEAPAVIITDIESLDDERAIALLYVGMSRARIRLYMLMQERCRTAYNRILDSGLAMTSKK